MSENSYSEASTRGVLWNNVFFEILQNAQENTCARVAFLIKLQASDNFIEHLWTLLFYFRFDIEILYQN